MTRNGQSEEERWELGGGVAGTIAWCVHGGHEVGVQRGRTMRYKTDGRRGVCCVRRESLSSGATRSAEGGEAADGHVSLKKGEKRKSLSRTSRDFQTGLAFPNLELAAASTELQGETDKNEQLA